MRKRRNNNDKIVRNTESIMMILWAIVMLPYSILILFVELIAESFVKKK